MELSGEEEFINERKNEKYKSRNEKLFSNEKMLQQIHLILTEL